MTEQRNSLLFLLLLEVHWKISFFFTYSWTWVIKIGAVRDIHFHRSKTKYWHILQNNKHRLFTWRRSLVPAETESGFKAAHLCERHQNPSSKSQRWEEQEIWSKKNFSNSHISPNHKFHRKRRRGHLLLCWVVHPTVLEFSRQPIWDLLLGYVPTHILLNSATTKSPPAGILASASTCLCNTTRVFQETMLDCACTLASSSSQELCSQNLFDTISQ